MRFIFQGGYLSGKILSEFTVKIVIDRVLFISTGAGSGFMRLFNLRKLVCYGIKRLCYCYIGDHAESAGVR